MLKAFHIFTVMLLAIAMALPLAHALEFPGKMRLARDIYIAVQPIYYPGFTLGAFVGEFGGMAALLALIYFTPNATERFWWILASFLLLLIAHLTYWFVTHPVNQFWVKDVDMGALGAGFFGLFSGTPSADWTQLRNIWEYSHVARAVLAMLSLLAATISLTV